MAKVRSGAARRTRSPAQPRQITATAAARGFSDLLNRVQYRGESVVIERNGIPVCRITPATAATCSAADLVEVLRGGPHADEAFADDLDRITREQPPVEPSPWGR